jgi:hypothetical protein
MHRADKLECQAVFAFHLKKHPFLFYLLLNVFVCDHETSFIIHKFEILSSFVLRRFVGSQAHHSAYDYLWQWLKSSRLLYFLQND